MKKEIAPEDILIDQLNLPSFDHNQLEGRIVKLIPNYIFYIINIVLIIVFFVFIFNAYKLQIIKGDYYNNKAENNRFDTTPIFPARGIIYDRNKIPLAWNEDNSTTGSDNLNFASSTFQIRKYRESNSIGNLLGYIKFPKKDKNGYFTDKEIEAFGGIEKYYNDILKGKTGFFYSEIDSQGNTISENTVDLPENGEDVYLTIDYDLQKTLFNTIQYAAHESGYIGGVALIVDLNDGSILSAVTYPDFNANIMSVGTDSNTISNYFKDKRSVFLNRYSDGLYAPGSIIKPIFALAALEEKIITPREKILSTGKLIVPNPYDATKNTIFKDWKAHGYTDVREAIAVSSDVYFYTIGGGVPGRVGLGITKLDEYAKYFGLDKLYEDNFFKTKKSIIPTPKWKAENFKGDIWRLGDTYNSSIGQYGFSVSPIQVLGMIMLLARDGQDIPEFKINKNESTKYIKSFDKLKKINKENYIEISEGMRMTVTAGTAQALEFEGLKMAGKTGTAQTGIKNQYINSWFVGFWPYTKPRYAVVYMLEEAPSKTTHGAAFYLRSFFEKCMIYKCDLINKNIKNIEEEKDIENILNKNSTNTLKLNYENEISID